MFSSNRRGVRDIYKRRPSGEGADELVYESTTDKSVNAWSRDGRFLVYDTGGGSNGGREPAWRGDGRELFFLSEDTVMSVDVHTSAVGIEWSAPRPLFKIPNYQSFLRGFTVSGDGQRFVAVVETTPTEPQKFTTVLNWTSLVK